MYCIFLFSNLKLNTSIIGVTSEAENAAFLTWSHVLIHCLGIVYNICIICKLPTNIGMPLGLGYQGDVIRVIGIQQKCAESS